jgi:hypothetical protein
MDHIAYSLATVGLKSSFRAIGSVWIHVYVGRSVFRRFEQLNANGDRLNEGLQTIPDGTFARAGITWRIPMGDD